MNNPPDTAFKMGPRYKRWMRERAQAVRAKAFRGRQSISFSSRLVPYISGESVDERHQRRFNAAMAAITVLEAWCDFRGIVFTVSGRGSHPNDVVFRMRVPLVQDAAICFWAPNRGRAWRTPSCRTQIPTYQKIHDWEQLVMFCGEMFDSIRSLCDGR